MGLAPSRNVVRCYRLIILAVLFLQGGIRSSSAQPVKYWIFFPDKPAAESSAGKLESSSRVRISDRALRRRATRGTRTRGRMTRGTKSRGTGLTRRDLDVPVSIVYLDQLSRLGIEPLVTSRWLNATSAVLDPEQLAAVKNLGFVKDTRPVGVAVEAVGPAIPMVSPIHVAPLYRRYRIDYGESLEQLALVNAIGPIEDGITGVGVIVGFLDSTFGDFAHPVFAHLQSTSRILGYQDFSQGPQSSQHGLSVASIAVGFAEGELVGPAHGASVLAATTEYAPTETNQEEDNYVAGLEWMESQGVDVVNTSLGYSSFDAGQHSYTVADMDGDTGITTIAADIAASLGVVMVNSAGNESCSSPTLCWYYITTPADGDSVIAVGAADASGNVVSFSGRGPTADQRIKPDVAAMGTGVYVATGTETYGFGGGTSYSSPMVAGVVAQLLQANPALAPMEVLEVLRTTASQANEPDNDLGWGIIDAGAAVAYATQLSNDAGDTTTASLTILPPFPNPADVSLTLAILTTGVTEDVSVVVFDVLGRIVIEKPVGALAKGRTDLGIDTSALPAGLYHARLTRGVAPAMPFSVVH